ncbi:uncharacterized protein [Pseudorca crassidens]|uniref:uncharacterized protein n=1 Tax=Pseudorca crassidens TaxID=82174 RepID=UPI00352F225A
MPLPAVPLLAFQASPVPGGQPGSISAPQESAPGPRTRKPLPAQPREGPGAHCRPRWGDQVDADGRSAAHGSRQRRCLIFLGGGAGVQGHPHPPPAITHTLILQARAQVLVSGCLGARPAGSAGVLGPELAFPGILESWSRGAERAPRTLLSPGSGRSGFSEPPVSLGVKLPLLPREAHRRAEAALGLRLRSVNRAAPAAICSRVGDSEIFTPSSQRQPHACGAFSRVERKAGPATSGTPRGAPRPPPGEDLVEEDRLCVAYPEGAASRASEPPARTAPGTTPSCAHSGPEADGCCSSSFQVCIQGKKKKGQEGPAPAASNALYQERKSLPKSPQQVSAYAPLV